MAELSSLRAVCWYAVFDAHPGFYPLVSYVWLTIFGDSEIAVRMPSLLFGLGSIALLYQLGNPLVGRRTALLAALLLAVSPVHVWYSQEARPYAFQVLAVLLRLETYHHLREVGEYATLGSGVNGELHRVRESASPCEATRRRRPGACSWFGTSIGMGLSQRHLTASRQVANAKHSRNAPSKA